MGPVYSFPEWLRRAQATSSDDNVSDLIDAWLRGDSPEVWRTDAPNTDTLKTPSGPAAFRVEISVSSTGGAAFDLEGELTRILSTVPGKIGRQWQRAEALYAHDEEDDLLRDIYGNRVGTVRLIREG